MAPYGGPTKSGLLVMTMALPATNPRLLLVFFLLVLTHAYSLPVRREKSDYDPDEKYYMNGDIRCFRCSPGTYVLNPCTSPDTPSICAPCLPGQTYSEHLTGLDYCMTCTVCRKDQEEVSPCTSTKNTICQCKKGTYCPPGDPCEICQKCTTSCPPDQAIQTPCNSTSDAQCGPPENDNSILVISLALAGIFILLVVACLCFFFWRRRNFSGSRLIPKILTISLKREEASAEDTDTPFLPQAAKLRFKENMPENEKNEAINRTFNVFLDLVPPKRFEQFVRELGLSNIEIEREKMDSVRDTYNQHYHMLLLLHRDLKFDVNVWLKKLHVIKMKEVAQDITEKLTTEGLFERSTEG